MSSLHVLVDAVKEGREGDAVAAAKAVIEEKLPIEEIIEGLTGGMRDIGDQFARMEIFLSEMMMAAQAMKGAMTILEPEIEASAAGMKKKGTIVIGTVEGDMHEIGKNIVITLLQAQGFEVHDLGINVNALDFVKEAEKIGADIIGASSLMTTTMPYMKDIIEILKEKSVREKYHVILGGAPVTLEWVEECGADSWGENAGKAVEILEKVMEERGK
jgi:corrinoid protein of di/trimethylamine methyltransferase